MIATLSILTLPQRWSGNKLTLRAVVLPRNYNPLQPMPGMGPTPWVDARMALRVRLVTANEIYPSLIEPDQQFALPSIAMPANTRQIFEALDQQFGGIPANAAAVRLQDPKPNDRARKYLPESYRSAFNFTAPRTPDASVDDSYRCTIRDKGKADPTFQSRYDLSWGKVFAYCLRQPALAQRVGSIYEATIDVDPALMKDGGWVYVDLADGCSYKPAADGNQKLVKRYAAKLPKLKPNEDRTLFAAVQFPVLIKAQEPADKLDADIPLVPSSFDELLIETAQYDDGFCKIVHASQPVSSDLLREDEDKDLPVITEAGIRLGWDDEQLLIWLNRQMKGDESLLPAVRRTDAPMGVFQYRIDVREHSDADPNPNPWAPLCAVRARADLMLGGQLIDKAGREGELGVEVYPSKPDARQNQPFWLPQHFAYWVGNSLVLPDNDAIDIFKKAENTEPKKKGSKNEIYNAAGMDAVRLLYGTKYDFRVRLADVSGGGPALSNAPKYAGIAPTGFCDFRRHVQPQAMRLQNKLPDSDDYFTGDELVMKRPLLGYPAVLFTGQYPNAVADLIADTDKVVAAMKKNPAMRRPIGLPDPDVETVEVLVEVKALGMDLLLRDNTDSRESWARLYRTKRRFPGGFNDDLSIPLTFVDAPVLSFTDSQDLGNLGLVPGGDNVDDRTDVVLPTARDVRITLRPVVQNKPEYYAKASELPKKGKPVVLITRKASTDERSLFKPVVDVDTIRGVWLQPDTDTYLKATVTEIFVENNSPAHSSSMMERLVDAIDKSIEVESKGMSLVGKRGCRIQFGASRLILHNLSPDSTSITIATKSDLLNQWIVPITLLLNRDWTWDGAAPVSFNIYRQRKFVGADKTDEERDAVAWGAERLVGDIEMKPAVNIQALYNPDRSQTYLCFLDAVEPKPKDLGGFPEEMMVRYRIEPKFKHAPAQADDFGYNVMPLQLHLPITGKPAQVPRIVSAGIAQSKYVSNETYSSTEPRRRYLWLEFDEPIQNPADTYFIRMLAYSPDPLLSNWELETFKAPEESTLPVNPEPIRLIAPQHTDDKAGLNAMQELTPADKKEGKSVVHYLVPLPSGLHASSAELFGFFTYELRVGHKTGWSTAQARFGSPLRTTGVQHPPPQLFCIVARNEKHIMVTAPFAQTVFNGADVTSKPPRTQLWALLYAQVKRADNEAYRNILLDDQLFIRRRTALNAAGAPTVAINTDAVQYGITGWKNKDVERILEDYGLPVDSALSVLVVEMLPTYGKFFARPDFRGMNNTVAFNRSTATTNIVNLQEGMAVQHFKSSLRDVGRASAAKQQQLEAQRQLRLEEGIIAQADKEESVRPLTEQLGSERILRTSTLVPVPEICCTDCD